MDFIAANIQKYADGHTSEESQLIPISFFSQIGVNIRP